MRVRSSVMMFVMLVAWACHAAEYHIGGTLSSDNGLPHYQVNTIATDSKGYVWVGTRNGLSRYDGYSVKNYFNLVGDPASLRHNYVRKVFFDSARRMWVLTIHGLSRYNPDTDSFVNYGNVNADMTTIAETPDGRLLCAGGGLWVYVPEKDSFRRLHFDTDFILSLASDRNNYVYVSTNQAIYRIDPDLGHAHLMPRHLYEDVTTGAGDIIPLMVDSKNYLWIGRNGKGIARYNPQNGHTDIIDDALPHGMVRAITEDRKGNIIVGTSNGTCIIASTPDGIAVKKMLSAVDDNSVYALMADDECNIWIGTYFGGITIMTATDRRFRHISQEEGLRGNVVRMMSEPVKGTLWIASEDGGINILDMASGRVTPFDRIPEAGTNIHSLAYDRKNHRMWIGSFLNGLFSYDLRDGTCRRYLFSNGLNSNSIFYLAYSSDSTLCVATTRGMRTYNPETDTFDKVGQPQLDWNFVYTFLPCDNGNLWVGTTTEGLFHIDGKNCKITSWLPDSAEHPLADRFVTSLCRDSAGKLWVGTNNSGMQIINADGSTAINRSDHRTICAIADDKEGNMWVTTSTGIWQYDIDGNEMACYTTANGLPTNQMNLSSIFKGSDGRIYAGSIKGLVSFLPSEPANGKTYQPVRLKTLWVNGVEIHPADSTGIIPRELDDLDRISLSYSQCRPLTIEFGVVIPGKPNTVSYQIMLEGSDSYWRNVGHEREVSLFNLAPGHYTLHIRANNASSDWEEMPVRTLQIDIAPPFYRSTVAILIYASILLVPGVFLFVRRRQRRSYGTAVNTSVGSESVEATPSADSGEDSGYGSNLLERKFISDVDSLIAENLSNSEFCVDNITASLGMSRTLLHNRMKSLTGMSISEYIREKRLAEAGRLLADGFNVSETAYRCGFADPSHFSKVFKRKFGVPPSHYDGKNR